MQPTQPENAAFDFSCRIFLRQNQGHSVLSSAVQGRRSLLLASTWVSWIRDAFTLVLLKAYLRGVDAAPFEPVDEPLTADASAEAGGIDPGLLEELWRKGDAETWGLGRDEFNRILVAAGMAQNFGLSAGASATPEHQAAFLRELKLDDLVLAKACAAGNERAWEHFVAHFGQALTRAAIAICGSESIGRDLADAFYAELYGLSERDGVRRCPLDSYRGRGSLLGWLRTTLAQRFVDHHRRTYREQPLDELDAPAQESGDDKLATSMPILAQAVEGGLQSVDAEGRFMLAAYYLDQRTLAQIAGVLHVHEATVSRRLHRATDSVRKEVLRNLMNAGMSRRAAEEALGTDPRDVELKMDLKRLLQNPEATAFPDKAPPDEKALRDAFSNETISDKAAG
jgi:RNA polymerase sigma-70 factor, ECF subfamily